VIADWLIQFADSLLEPFFLWFRYYILQILLGPS
jgi:hypothetical protein